MPLQVFGLNGIMFYHPFFSTGLLNAKVVAQQFWIIQAPVGSPTNGFVSLEKRIFVKFSIEFCDVPAFEGMAPNKNISGMQIPRKLLLLIPIQYLYSSSRGDIATVNTPLSQITMYIRILLFNSLLQFTPISAF